MEATNVFVKKDSTVKEKVKVRHDMDYQGIKTTKFCLILLELLTAILATTHQARVCRCPSHL
jgi:hypothetical protein